MSLWRIAWRSIEQRGIASLLTALSMALGVMMVIAVLSISGVVSASFRSNASLGYNMIVGAKGGKLQLTLNTVYYLSQPVENVPYELFLEFVGREERDRELRNSLRHQALLRADLAAITGGLAIPDASAKMGGMLIAAAFHESADRTMDLGRNGKYQKFTELAIPLCLGDYLGRFRVIGTTTDFFDKLTFGPENDKKYTFREGRNFEADNAEHRYFEAVLGAEVAREMGLSVGDQFATTHGDPEGHGHGRGFTVVGVLNPSGTPNDRAAFVNMDGFYLMEDHAKPLDHAEGADDAHEAADHGKSPTAANHDMAEDHPGDPDQEETPDHGDEAHGKTDDHEHAESLVHEGDEHPETAGKEPEGDVHHAADGHDHESEGDHHEVDLHAVQRLLLEEREVTAILVRTVNPLVTPGLRNTINEGQQGQAVLPVMEIYSLFESIVRPFQLLLLALTGLICIVSGISILVSIYNSMSDRRHEIAVMRALGANRSTVMLIILLEAILLSLGGGAAGWMAAHGVNWLASARIEAQTGVTVRFWDLAPPVRDVDLWGLEVVLSRISPEALIVPLLIVLAIVVGLLPAIAAYRTDVSKSLQS